MKLQSLTLHNFKGIRDFSLDLQGRDVSIYGDNGTGKTTIFDAFTWLLFDKDSKDQATFDIKTLDADNKPLPGLDHEVEAVLDLGGRTITLKKSYKEVYTKKRGSAEASFTGHTTDYFVDGVPVKKKEYDETIAEIADEGVFKLLTNPRFFNDQLHWQKRRELLLEVCGDVSDADVIKSDKALAALPEILGARSMDKHRDMVRAQMTAINKELQQIPVRIDEATRALPELPKDSRTAFENELKILGELKDGAEKRRLRIEGGGEVAEKKKALAELDAELLEWKAGMRVDIDAGIETEQSKIRQYGREADALRDSIERSRRQINGHQDKIKEAEAEMDRLRAEWEKVNEQEFKQDSVNDACPTCNRPLPAEEVEEARQKALEAFNCKKAEELQRISISGKAWKARAEEHKEKIAEIEAEIADIQNSVDAAEADKAAAQARLVKLEEQLTAIEQNEEYQRKLKERQALVDAIAALEADTGPALLAVEGELAELSIKILSKQAIIRKFDAGLATGVFIEFAYDRLFR